MIERNPFLSIIPEKQEPLFGIDNPKIKDYAKKLSEGNSIVIISGEAGSGKSALVFKLEKQLPKKIKKIKTICSPRLSKELKEIKTKGKTVIFIEKLHVCMSLNEAELKNTIDTIGNMLSKNMSFVLTATPTLAATIPYLSNKLKNILVFDIPPLSLGDAKKLVVSRLNKIRKKRSDSISPFTENEIMQVWRKSNGNPKMVLLLCASLYGAKESS